MNKLTIIGNLTRDPELRTTTAGVNVCDFTIAVNRPRRNGEDQGADFFRVTAWRERGELCAKFLRKGNKACVIGPVSVRTYAGNDGVVRASLEVTADEIEFLSPKVSDEESPVSFLSRGLPTNTTVMTDDATGFEQVDTDELPF